MNTNFDDQIHRYDALGRALILFAIGTWLLIQSVVYGVHVLMLILVAERTLVYNQNLGSAVAYGAVYGLSGALCLVLAKRLSQ
jgi:hypothetical protein